MDSIGERHRRGANVVVVGREGERRTREGGRRGRGGVGRRERRGRGGQSVVDDDGDSGGRTFLNRRKFAGD